MYSQFSLYNSKAFKERSRLSVTWGEIFLKLQKPVQKKKGQEVGRRLQFASYENVERKTRKASE